MVRKEMTSQLVCKQKFSLQGIANGGVVQRQIVGIGLKCPMLHDLDARQDQPCRQDQHPRDSRVVSLQPAIGRLHLSQNPHAPFAPEIGRPQYHAQHQRPIGMC